MSLPPSTTKKSYTLNLNKIEGAKKGKLYEIISLLTLANRGYELSIDNNTKFRDFSIGREVGIGKYRKFDDVVFTYVDEENTKNFIFMQLKHYQYYNLIDSWVLSTEADRAKDVAANAKVLAKRVEDVRYGNMCKDFNFQQYFISFLSAREELENTNTEELKDGKIKYVVLFTNIGLHSKELEGKGFSFNKAPGDIVDLFTLSSEAQHYQLGDVSEGLRKILEKSSDLDRLARELARYVVCKDYRENRVMGTQETPIKYYHVALGEKVIQISPLKQVANKQYFREAQFRDVFLDCDGTAPNLHQLRNGLYEAVRDLDESKKDADDDELKRVLKEAKWKIVYNFEKSKQIDFPCEWMHVKDEDIKDFLRCFVFIVNQPRMAELELLYKNSIQDAVVENTSMKQFVDNINATGPEFRDCVEKLFGLDIKPHDDEKWISRNQIEDFMKEKQQLLRAIFVASSMTLMYKNEIMQYGEFNDFGKIKENVKNFLTSDCKILCFNTPVTLLSSIKISQHFDTENLYPISVSLNILNSTENRYCVLKAFELESISLLTIECRHAFKDQDINFLYEIFNVAKTNSNKKIILIMQQENCCICIKRFKTDFQDEGICIIENDSINLKDFEPKEDPLAKKVLVFQEQKEKVSLSYITGINSWNSYVGILSEGNSEQGAIDGMTLVDILSNDEIEVGSKPAGTSSLEGAYAQMYEEINVENLVDKLRSQERGNDTKDMFIISGISGSSKQDKTDKVIQYLGLNNNKEIIQDQLGEIDSEGKIQIADDQFKDKDFQRLSNRYPEKRIFWISVKCEIDVTKFILQEIYNPKFYLKRKFKNVIIKNDLKKHLIKDDLSETFIFHCAEDKQQLYKSMELNEREIDQFEDNCKIRIFFQKSDAESNFRELSKQNETVHFLEFEKQQFVWCESYGSVKYLQKFIDHKRNELQAFDDERSEIFLIEEDKLIEKIKDRKVVIFADDPGMGKTTTIIKLYETEIDSSSIIKSHWIVGIKIRDHLEAVSDHDFEKDGINTHNVIEFLSKIDLKLNNNLAKNLLKIVLVKSENFQGKPLLLIFDGFDEVLDEDVRNQILLLLKFIKNKTAAKLWITTRCHFKNLLEEELSTVAFEFSPMDDTQKGQFITSYIKHRLYLILNKDKYTDLFYNGDEKQNNEKIHMYTAEFIKKMKSIFRGDIATFMGTPLQFYLMLEGIVRNFKNWIEEGDGQIPVFKYVFNDVWDVYEYFIKKKYDVYFLKIGIRERKRQRLEKCNIDRYHKDFAASKILEVNRNDDFEQYKDVFLLVGVIKSQESELEFIHKTFEEFFAAKVFFDWIKKVPETVNQEYLIKVIFMKPDYELVRTFINLQLQKMSEQATEERRQNELDKSLEHYGEVVEKLINEEESDEKWTPLHIAVKESNKDIARFLLNSLRGHSYVQRKFLFTVGEYITPITTEMGIIFKGNALHLACKRDDVEIVKVLLDAAKGISEDTLQEFLKCLDYEGNNALRIAVLRSHNVQIFNELFSRANNKLDLILAKGNVLCDACSCEKEEVVELLLQEFKHDKHSLKQLLLHRDMSGNSLYNTKCHTTVEKLLSAAKSIEDNNETLKKLLLPKKCVMSFYFVVCCGNIDAVEKLLNVAKEINDDNYTLKQLLLNETTGESALLLAARWGLGHIVKLLLQAAADLGIEMLEKLIFAVDEKGENAIELMFKHGHESIFADSFKILEEYKYQNIRKKVTEMLDNIPLEIRLYLTTQKLVWTIKYGDIEIVKDILSNAQNYSVSANESLRILLLAENMFNRSPLYVACERGNSKMIKELLSYAMNMDDGGATLKELLIKTPFQTLEHGYTSEIKQIAESLIFEARNNNREHVVNILEEINNQYSEVKSSSEELDDISEKSDDISEESDDISEESDDISEESDDISEESDISEE